MQGKEKTKPKNFLTSPADPKTSEGRASPGFGHRGSLPRREVSERASEAGPHTPTTDRTSKGAPRPADRRSPAPAVTRARPSPAPQPSPASLPPLGEILDGCTLVRPLLLHFSLQFPPTLVLIPLAGTRVCPNSPASLFPLPPPSRRSSPAPPPREALDDRSRVRAASPVPPRLPASRDAGVLLCSGQQPLPERVPT